jgi:hypothetical protein
LSLCLKVFTTSLIVQTYIIILQFVTLPERVYYKFDCTDIYNHSTICHFARKVFTTSLIVQTYIIILQFDVQLINLIHLNVLLKKKTSLNPCLNQTLLWPTWFFFVWIGLVFRLIIQIFKTLFCSLFDLDRFLVSY